MTEISIYYPTQLLPEKVLAKVLEKVLEGGQKALVLADSLEKVGFLNTMLWTYHPSSFLPHGTKEEGWADRQPIWISDKEENLNGASVLVSMETIIPASWQNYEKFIMILSGSEEEETLKKSLEKGRRENDTLSVFHQESTGSWKKVS